MNHLVYKTFASLDLDSGSGKDVLLLLFKPWGADHTKAITLMERVAKVTAAATGLLVARLDTSKNYVPEAMFDGYAPPCGANVPIWSATACHLTRQASLPIPLALVVVPQAVVRF